MLSITGVSAGQASTYYAKDSYYLKDGGQWQGKGAEALGLQGSITKDDFNNLLHGRDTEGNELIQAGVNGGHRAGIDLTFSAPKSVSILSEIAGDERVREAHDKAIEKSLEYVEENLLQARQTQNGITERVDTGNLVVARFEHDLSRELDPQLHDHALILNITQREDGQWRAITNEKLYENKMLVGQIYRSELAQELKALGYDIQSDHKGLFEVKGIDKEVIDTFSQRKEQIDERVQELKDAGLYPNANEQKLREIAALGSREAKKDVDIDRVKEAWNERLKELGYTKEDINKAAEKAGEDQQKGAYNEYSYTRTALKAITEQESTFTKGEVLREAMKFSVGEYRVSRRFVRRCTLRIISKTYSKSQKTSYK